MLTPEIKTYIEKSVLCWLATSSSENIPNVSPKEAFTYYGDDQIIIANISSPQTVENIESNKNVCASFIDVYIQKGFQVKGQAIIIKKSDEEFDSLKEELEKMTKGKYPYSSITVITAEDIKRIIAPSYYVFPETTEQQQIENSIESYGR